MFFAFGHKKHQSLSCAFGVIVLFVHERYHIAARLYQGSTGSTILRWGLYQVSTSGTILLRDCTKCPQAVQYCDEFVSSVHKQCNLATRLYQVSTSSTILREPLFYLRTSSVILRQDGIICPQVVHP